MVGGRVIGQADGRLGLIQRADKDFQVAPLPIRNVAFIGEPQPIGGPAGEPSYSGVSVTWVSAPVVRSIQYRSQSPSRLEAKASRAPAGCRAG